MSPATHRRQFLRGSLGLAFAALARPMLQAKGEIERLAGTNIALSLNAYSFNQPLRDGRMTLADVVEYCARRQIPGLDATGYYFPRYPETPSDEFVYRLKRQAYVNGVTIHGTGVRNDFATPDRARRQQDVQLVKNWIEVARKLGATEIRVFSGQEVPAGYRFDQVIEWMAADMRECAEYGRNHGVIVSVQHHHDFLRTAAETIQLVQAVDSKWFAVKLDVGSLRTGDPYDEIEKLLPYAVSWQLKENIWYGAKEVPTDLGRVRAIIEKIGFSGFLPVETLGSGDPEVKLARFLERVRREFGPLVSRANPSVSWPRHTRYGHGLRRAPAANHG